MIDTKEECVSAHDCRTTRAFIASRRSESLGTHGHAFAILAAITAFALVLLTTPVRSLAAPSPIASYNFDAGAGVSLVDQSGNNHPGTLVNGPTWATGRYSGGLAFDGVDDYVSMGDFGQADGLTAITVSTWVKFAVNGGAAVETHFVDKSQCNGVSGGGPWELGASLFGTHKAEFVIYPQGGNPSSYVASGSGVTSIDDGAWHYVTGRYDGTNLSIWVDGNLENSHAVSGLTMSSSSSAVDLGGYCNGYSRYPFKGTLDDVRIYSRALTPSEILGDMATPVSNGAPPPPPPADTTAPSTPTGLSTSGVTTTQVTLSWQASADNVGVAGYRVYRNGLLAGTASSTTFTNSGLLSNTSYVFTVAAFDAAGNTSPQSAPRSVTTTALPPPAPPPPPVDTTAPSTPMGLSTSGVTTAQVTLSWQASADNVGVAGYRVYRNGLLAGTTSSISFTNSGLVSNTSYVFTVTAFDAAGNASPQSAPRSVTTSPAAASGPSPIASYNFDAGAGVSLVDQSGNNHPGTLVNGPTWATGRYSGGLAFDGVDDYVSMGDFGQADGLTAITVSTWVKFAVNGGAAVETHFVDKSQCNGVSGGGPWELGASLFGTHKAEFVIYPQGGNPSSYVASGSGVTSIDDGAWHYVTGRYDGTNLSIWVDGNLENSHAVSGLTMSSSSSAVDLGGYCNGYSRYPFKGTLDDVRIYSRALTPSEILGDMATPVSNGAPPPPPPADTTAPSTPTGLSTSGVTTTQVTLSWQASADNVGVAGYRVYRNGLLAGTASSTTFTNSGLLSNTSYVFTVAAFDAAGNTSPQSAPRSVTTTATSAGSYSTSFDATENPLSEAGKWIDGKAVGVNWNNPQSASGKAYASVLSGASGSRYDDSVAHLSTSFLTFNANQYAQGTVYRVSGYSPGSSKHEIELLLRFQINANNARGYEVMWGISGYIAVVRWNGALGDYTPIYDPGNGSIPVPQDGDVLRAEITGNFIKVYRNGVQVGPNIDVTSIPGQVWSSGQPGLGFWPVDSSTPENYGWKTFEAGSL